MRSTTAPDTSAMVIAANIAWNAANARCGIVPAYVAFGFAPTSVKPAQCTPPMIELPGENASEYPITTHCTLITPSAAMLIMSVLSVLFFRTSPP